MHTNTNQFHHYMPLENYSMYSTVNIFANFWSKTNRFLITSFGFCLAAYDHTCNVYTCSRLIAQNNREQEWKKSAVDGLHERL